MRAVEVPSYGGPEVLTVVERPEPAPDPARVRVRVEATTVNPVDLALRAGFMAPMLGDLPFPFVLGIDLAGVVLDDRPPYRSGQRVIGFYPWLEDMTGRGTNAEVVLCDPGWLAPLPDGLDAVTAATVPLNGRTALQAEHLSDVPAGGSLLVTGASGGVGGFAVQLAAQRGLQVTAVASPGDEAYVRDLGADVVLTRDSPQALAEAVARSPRPRVHAVYDAAGVGQPLVAAVHDDGVFLSVLAPVPVDGRPVRSLHQHATADSAQLAELVQALARGDLRSRVADTLPLEQASAAHQRAADGGLRGKLVLTA